MSESLSDRIRSEAAIASRPGQYDRLEAIADEVDRLRAETLREAARAYDLDFVSVWLHERADAISSESHVPGSKTQG